MAAITTQEILKSEGAAEKMVLYRVKNVTTSDTMALANDFTKIKIAVQVAAGDPTTSDEPGISANTTLTFDAVGLVKETLYVLVLGNAA